VAGKSVDQLQAYLKGRSAVPLEPITGLCAVKGVSLDWLAFGTAAPGRQPAAGFGAAGQDRTARAGPGPGALKEERSPFEAAVGDQIPPYPGLSGPASAGPGDPGAAVVPAALVRRLAGRLTGPLATLTAPGDAMAPTITAGDLVVVDTGDLGLSDGALYALRSDGHPLLRRVTRQAHGGVRLLAEQPGYGEELVTTGELDRLETAIQTLAALWCDAHGTPRDADARNGLADRLAAYMEKAAREAKQQTSWISPNTDYEAALEAFVRGVTTDPETPAVLDEFAVRLAEAGFANRLSQLALKCTAPGVPDVYRGTEGADLSLVDPDNRRPVDWEARRTALDALGPLVDDPSVAAVRDLFADPDPRAYLYLTTRLLRWRRAHPDLVAAEGYVDLTPEGTGADDWLAFGRFTGPEDDPDAALLTVVSRHPLTRDSDAPATLPLPDMLAGRTWTDVLTGTAVEADAALDVQALPTELGAVLAAE
jgi:uncharacterized protein YdhG (YjbR/CyaY superfamily)